MAVAPDSRYYVHASTHAAKAQQQYLVDQAGPPQARAASSARARWFDLRADRWIILAVAALAAGLFLLVILVG